MATSTPEQPGIKPLLTKKETAKLYAVTERTIDRWLLENILPTDAKVIIGGSVRFRQQVLLDDIASHAGAGDADRA